MSEHRQRQTLLGGLLAMVLMATAPATANASEGCAQMSLNFLFCAEGSPWAEAHRVQFGDGSAMELEPYWLEYSEQWATRQAGDTLQEALDDLLAEMHEADVADGLNPPEVVLRDGFETGQLRVERVVNLIDLGDDMPELMAVMIAESGDARIALLLGIDDTIAPEDFARSARDLVELIRPGQEG